MIHDNDSYGIRCLHVILTIGFAKVRHLNDHGHPELVPFSWHLFISDNAIKLAAKAQHSQPFLELT